MLKVKWVTKSFFCDADQRFDWKVKCPTGRTTFWVKFPSARSKTPVKCPGYAWFWNWLVNQPKSARNLVETLFPWRHSSLPTLPKQCGAFPQATCSTVMELSFGTKRFPFVARIKTTQTQPIPDQIYNGEPRVHNSSRVSTLYRVESGERTPRHLWKDSPALWRKVNQM